MTTMLSLLSICLIILFLLIAVAWARMSVTARQLINGLWRSSSNCRQLMARFQSSSTSNLKTKQQPLADDPLLEVERPPELTKSRPLGRPDASRPELWKNHFPIAVEGHRQSPIDIITSKCEQVYEGVNYQPLEIKYPESVIGATLKNPNDVFGWRVDIGYDIGRNTRLSGGPLFANYQLAQFHAHWGPRCGCGSEHRVDGKCFDAELHFVHWNVNAFKSVRDAIPNESGLAVIAVFLKASTTNRPNPELAKLTKLMPTVKYRGDKMVMDQPINLANLLPKRSRRSYWTYSGSLTTPPLTESVTWIVFESPVECTDQQIDEFRQLSYYPRTTAPTVDNRSTRQMNSTLMTTTPSSTSPDSSTRMLDNTRPTQPLRDRRVVHVTSL